MPLLKSANVPSSIMPFSMRSIENQARGILTQAQKQAEDLLAAAQTEAQALKSTAHLQGVADGKRDGIAQGLAEGKKTGHDQAIAEHKDKFTTTMNALQKAANEFESQRGELQAQGLRSVIELSAAIARRITRRQAEIDPEVLIANLEGAMKLVCHWTDARIAVSQRDLAVLKLEMPNLKLKWPQLAHVELVEDAALTPGGCRLFTAAGSIDADLEAQLDRVIEQVLPVRPRQDSPPKENPAKENPAKETGRADNVQTQGSQTKGQEK